MSGPSLEHICFDCDNTLYRETPEMRDAWFRAIIPEFADAKNLPIGTAEKVYRDMHRAVGSHTEIFKTEGIPLEICSRAKRKVRIWDFLAADGALVELFDYIKDRGLGTSVFSTSEEGTVREILGKLGVDAYISFIVTPSIEGIKPKPSDTGYRFIEERAGCPPHCILMVGDRVHYDLAVAKAMGWRTAWVAWQFESIQYDFNIVDSCLHDIYETRRLIDTFLSAESKTVLQD